MPSRENSSYKIMEVGSPVSRTESVLGAYEINRHSVCGNLDTLLSFFFTYMIKISKYLV